MSSRNRYITIDIYVPRSRWDGASALEIRRYLAASAEAAVRKMLDKLHRDKVPVEEDALLKDLAKVKDCFLSNAPSGGGA